MPVLRFTLLSDGSSDRVLLPILEWLLRRHSTLPLLSQWADLRFLRRPPRTFVERIEHALRLYPCEILFVHRDAEREPLEARRAEILAGLHHLGAQPAVCVVPVRMMEAWLLFDEAALRVAADNPRGQAPIPLPDPSQVELEPHPKKLLHELLWTASGLRPGRRTRFAPEPRVHRLAELIQDYSPLRHLAAFRALEADLSALLAERSWQ